MAYIDVFQDKFSSFQESNISFLRDLVVEVEGHHDLIGEVLDDYSSMLKDSLGASAANEAGDNEIEQESAISGEVS